MTQRAEGIRVVDRMDMPNLIKLCRAGKGVGVVVGGQVVYRQSKELPYVFKCSVVVYLF